MKLLSAEQIKALDEYTIVNEPISSLDLMERAAKECTDFLMSQFQGKRFTIVAGTGNNGGDGLAIARQLDVLKQECSVLVIGRPANGSQDFKTNLERLKLHPKIDVSIIDPEEMMPVDLESGILVDALFGTGLTRSIEGGHKSIIHWINAQKVMKVSIDLPSGMMANLSPFSQDEVVKANHTLSFQLPKIPFLFDEHRSSAGRVHILEIGLNKAFHEQLSSLEYFLTRDLVQELRRKRHTFSHKRSFGHVLLAAGSKGKVGAAVLASAAVLKGGAGLLTCKLPGLAVDIMHNSVPEAMVIGDQEENFISHLPSEGFSTAVIGPGMGIEKESIAALENFIEETSIPLVLDADALNALALRPEWWSKLKGRAILTPHPGEFDRLTGSGKNQIQQYKALRELAISKEVIVILKGAYSRVAMPDGRTYFNSTGNPGMATAGSGDVLAGLCSGILASGYSLEDAALMAVYLHGKSGDITADLESQESLTAQEILNNIGKAWKSLD